MTLFALSSTPELNPALHWTTPNAINAIDPDPLANPLMSSTHRASQASQALHSPSTSRGRDRNLQGVKQTIRGNNQQVLGTGRNDQLDASPGKGRNRLLGKGGNDRLKGKRQDRLLGGRGRDRLDTHKGRRNVLKGGSGRDVLFPGQRDKVFGNGGADKLDASKGKGKNVLNGGGGPDVLIGKKGDRLVGGNGSDEFVLINRTLPSQPLIIRDFQVGRDRLSVRKGPNGLSLSDLGFSQRGQNTMVVAQGQDIAILENVTVSQLITSEGASSALESSPNPSSALAAEGEGNPNANMGNNPLGNQEIAINPGTTTETVPSPVTVQQNNQYSITALDSSDILAQFDLSGVQASNTFIPDNAPSSELGFFTGGIQDYVASVPGRDNSSSLRIAPNQSAGVNIVDLRAELVQDANRNAFIANGRDTIEYVLIDPKLPASGNASSNALNNPANDKELLRLSLDFTSPFFAGFVPNFDQNQAINSIEYILENDLLAYAMRVQVAGTQLFSIGDVQNTKPSKTYSESGKTQFRLVASQQAIEDQNNAPDAGLFENTIEAFEDYLTGQSFTVGNLSTRFNGAMVTYTITNNSATTPVSQNAILDLTDTDVDADLAVNNLLYILANDLLKLAFFDS